MHVPSLSSLEAATLTCHAWSAKGDVTATQRDERSTSEAGAQTHHQFHGLSIVVVKSEGATVNLQSDVANVAPVQPEVTRTQRLQNRIPCLLLGADIVVEQLLETLLVHWNAHHTCQYASDIASRLRKDECVEGAGQQFNANTCTCCLVSHTAG
jgi:hypothetical protein